jgi:AcrR family transcriptional regulator
MTTLRHNDAEQGERSTADRLLDAARDTVLSIGWKRTTLTEVARCAGVSRMTVYRTYADMPALFGDLMTREWAGIAEQVPAEDSGPWPDRLASSLVGIVTTLREDELFRRIVDVDPELVLPYVLDRRGRTQDALLGLLAARIGQAQDEGGVRVGDPVLLARSLLLAAQGSLLSAHTMVGDGVDLAALDGELHELVRRYLAP